MRKHAPHARKSTITSHKDPHPPHHTKVTDAGAGNQERPTIHNPLNTSEASQCANMHLTPRSPQLPPTSPHQTHRWRRREPEETHSPFNNNEASRCANMPPPPARQKVHNHVEHVRKSTITSNENPRPPQETT